MDAEPTGAAAAAESALPATHKPSIAEHPRAARQIRQARQAAGLAGFLIAGWSSMATGTLAQTLLHALIAGIVCQLVVWGAAVLLFRHLILAELRSREHALVVAAKARAEARERAGAAAGPGARTARNGAGAQGR